MLNVLNYEYVVITCDQQTILMEIVNFVIWLREFRKQTFLMTAAIVFHFVSIHFIYINLMYAHHS